MVFAFVANTVKGGVMSDEHPMGTMLDRYLLNKLDRKRLEGDLFMYLRDNPHRFKLGTWLEDDRIDFLCWFYPRMSQAIDKYKPCGASFDSYLGTLIKWASIEYRAHEADCNALESACWKARSQEIVAETEAEYMYDGGGFQPRKNPRQVLMLTLKCCSYVSDDFSKRIAGAIGMKEECLHSLLDELRKKNAIREERLRTLEERCAAQYFRCVAFEGRLKAAPEGSAHKADMEQRLEFAKRRLSSMRRRLAHTLKEATNKEIAETLGIPKGTVDSCLFAAHRSMLKNKQGTN